MQMRTLFLLILSQLIITRITAQCDDFVMTITVDQPTCHNFNDGDIDLVISGGTQPYHVTVTDENGTVLGPEKKSQTLAGDMWYFIYVTDANGCELYDSVFVTNPPEIIAEISLTDPTFTGACDGIAEVDTVLNYQGDFFSISYYWSPGGPMGLGQNVKTDLCDAEYALTINDAFGCSITTDLFVGSVSVGELESQTDPVFFPNPFSESVVLSLNEMILPAELIIYDQLGNVVMNEHITNSLTNLNCENLACGIYYYSLNGATGKLIIVNH